MARLVYGIEERPPRLWETLLYGWQHTLVDISPFVLPLAIAAAIGMSPLQSAELINFCLVAMGVATLLQSTLGNRLPIVQGPSATLTGALVPVGTHLGAGAMWGAAFAGALIETLIGAARLPGLLRRFFPPVVAGTVVVAIGLSLGRLAVRLSVGEGRAEGWLLAVAVVLFVLALQRWGARLGGGLLARAAVFTAIWTIGVGGGTLLGRVDWSLVVERPWLQLPRLFPWGGPGFGWQFGIAATLAVAAGYLGSMVESVGDYVATCAVAETRLRDRHVNRGIMAEGLGCVASLALGGLPCTSYTQNVGIIATTGVASRTVVRVAGCVLLAYGLCPKFGALLVALPRPVLGGVFVIVCAMIVASGVRLIASAALSEGDLATVGLTLVVSVALPAYVEQVLGARWLASLPVLARLLATNGVVLAVLLAVTSHALLRRRR